ncbi:MAG: GntR family transcriptional regulator [Streptosporangiaceae bacterium]
MATRGDDRPRHEQIAADLREQIMSGEILPGTQLPSTPRLVERYGAANPTIQKALGALKDEGFLVSQQGKGVYVRNRQPFVVEVSPFFVSSPGGFTYDILEVTEARPPREAAEVLGLSEVGTAVLRRRLMRHRGAPVELDWSYYPAEIAAGSPLAGHRNIKGGAPRVLAELGYPQRYFTDRVSARMPTAEEVELLDLPGVPVIRQFRVIYSDNDRPVEVSVLIKGGHLYELLYRQPAAADQDRAA